MDQVKSVCAEDLHGDGRMGLSTKMLDTDSMHLQVCYPLSTAEQLGFRAVLEFYDKE